MECKIITSSILYLIPTVTLNAWVSPHLVTGPSFKTASTNYDIIWLWHQNRFKVDPHQQTKVDHHQDRILENPQFLENCQQSLRRPTMMVLSLLLYDEIPCNELYIFVALTLKTAMTILCWNGIWEGLTICMKRKRHRTQQHVSLSTDIDLDSGFAQQRKSRTAKHK